MLATFIPCCVSVYCLLCRVILFTGVYMCLVIYLTIANCDISVTYSYNARSYDVMFLFIELEYCTSSCQMLNAEVFYLIQW